MSVESSLAAYSEGEASSLLGLSRLQIRQCAKEGLLSCHVDADVDGERCFSFEDLVLLRAAKGLLEARVSPRRVRSALKKLKHQLPGDAPLSGLRINAEGREIVARGGGQAWNPESGQTILDFSLAGPPVQAIPLFERAADAEPAESSTASAAECYERACDLEAESPQQACAAYREVLALDPGHIDALLNLGRLLHEGGDLRKAESHYLRALEEDPGEATAAFNLGVVLEDLGRDDDALAAYERAVASDPTLCDPYHNAVRLYEARGDKAGAVRLLKRFRERYK